MKSIFASGVIGAIALAGMAMPAAAASLTFNFKTAASFVGDTDYTQVNVLSNNGFCLFGACALSASLAMPLPSLTIDEGQTTSFDFANWLVSSGFGGDSDARVEALLAFTTPDAHSVGSGGTGNYIRLGGIFRPGALIGSLVWDQNSHDVIAADGSTFTVNFENVAGFTAGGAATSRVSITVNDVVEPTLTGAAPEPATWGMLILGFGLIGGAARRRRAGPRVALA